MCKALDDSFLEHDSDSDDESIVAYCSEVSDNEDKSWMSFYEALFI